MPLGRAQKLGRLLAAARVWRANLIPGTSSSTYGPSSALLTAIEALDDDTVNETPDEEKT